jgi:hypothetical protein
LLPSGRVTERDDMSDRNNRRVLSSDGMVFSPKICPSIFDLLQRIESRDDDVSRSLIPDISGSDHAVDNEDGSDTEESVRRELLASIGCRVAQWMKASLVESNESSRTWIPRNDSCFNSDPRPPAIHTR